MIEKAPIIFHPYLKSVIWGGEKICRFKGIDQSEPNIGESWEISAVPGHESVAASGAYKGMTLPELIERFGEELLGREVMARHNGKFPLLVKLIDAADNLSVQVHPDDELAMERHNSLGKTEMWYIIQSDEKAKIYAGLNIEMTPDDYVRRVAEGTFAETLAEHDAESGDVFFLPAGRVHAIGAGNLLAEIQESSDITYRIYDYDRTDAAGNRRELHTELAKDAINYKKYDDYKSENPSDEIADAGIVDCSHFDVRRLLVEGEADCNFSDRSFTIIMCVKGGVTLTYPTGSVTLKQGNTVLCPAVLDRIKITGNGTVLTSQAK